MVVFISLGARLLFMRGFPLSAKSLPIIMSLYLIFLTVNLYPRFHKGADSFLVLFSFFSRRKERRNFGTNA